MPASATAHDRFDVVVVGGGINGTSAARELSASGYKVLLVEQADLANGASSRSSRILHCGLRYFETRDPVRSFLRSPASLRGAIAMASSAMKAREELVRLQPDRCKPFTMCFPLYGRDNFRGWHLDAGFALLKRLGPPDPPLQYKRLKAGIGDAVPFAADLRDQDDLLSLATYREYIIDWPDRLCVDAALEAERNGARIELFTKAVLRGRDADGDWLLDLFSREGDAAPVRAPLVLNMAGTWIDEVMSAQNDKGDAPRLVRGTKGAHIVVRLPDRYRGFGVAALNTVGMPIYCLPMQDDLFCIGPTETPFDGDAGEVGASDEDISFLLKEANHLLPALRLSARDVRFTWAGVRPLTFDPELPMGRRTREIHDLSRRNLPGVLAMTAGPVMSHRSAGRELRDAVSRRLPAPWAAAAGHRTPKPRGDAANPQSAPHEDLFRRAVVEEHARDLPGILYTRTGHAWGRHMDRASVEYAATCVADLLEWTPDQVGARVDDFMNYQATVFRAGSPHVSGSTSIPPNNIGE